MKELDELMVDKVIYALDTYPLGALEPYLASKGYIGNIVIKLTEGQIPFYLLMHFTKDSPFTGYNKFSSFISNIQKKNS